VLLLHECGRRGISRDQCIQQSNDEATASERTKSRYFEWVRRCYNIAGADWNILDSKSVRESDKVIGALFDVQVGKHQLKLHFVESPMRFDGLSVSVIEIDGVTTSTLVEQEESGCPRARGEFQERR
jgi:hypothetical protein